MMLKRRNGFSAAVLATVLTGSILLGGCGQGEGGGASSADTENRESTPGSNSQTESGEQADGKDGEEASGYQTTYGDKTFDNVTITVEIFDRSNAPEGSTVTDNKWTEYINQEMNKVGINVEFVAVPRSEEVTKLQTMMATGTSPDLTFIYNIEVAKSYFEEGGTYNLSEYVDGADQARNLKAYVTEDVLDYGRNENGELFAVTARRASGAMMETFIRKDWLDELNMEIPTTVEELHTVLKAFKDKYPDCVPYYSAQFGAYALAPLAHSFLESAPDGKTYNKNFWNLLYKDEGAVEYLRFLNTLYNEGLVEAEYYTAADGELGKLAVNGQVGVYEANVNYNVATDRGSLLQTLKETDPDAEYVSIPPFKNVNDGQLYNPGYALNGMSIFVPKTAKNVEACITYLDWLATQEGGFTLYHGFEGEHFQYEDGVPVVKDMDYNAKDKDWICNDLFLVGNSGYFKSEKDFMESTAQSYGEWKQYVLDNYVNATAGTVRSQTVWVSPTHRENSTELGLAGDEYLVKCITCAPGEFDANIEAYRAALKEAGADDIQKEYEDYYDSFN
ncbi:extracellular solute-binding protein [Acetatifactor muris]|nr:extracellular solute-binding protein [Acetatifactor muris]MCR2045790.1 extracellular solute-binding protein [Acetatifactor muris]